MKDGMTMLMLSVAIAWAGSNGAAGQEPASAFSRLEALAGTWEGTNPVGKTARVTYEVTSDGSIVLERMEEEDGPTMITVYYTDGDELWLTHFCAAHNQPRMKALPSVAGADTLVFQFVDGTNISPASPGHMVGLHITLRDPDTLVNRWVWKEGQRTVDKVFELSRLR